MIIASYRHTERGIHNARQKPAALRLVPPLAKPLIIADSSLVAVFAAKFEIYSAMVNAEYALQSRVKLEKRTQLKFERIVQRFCCVFGVQKMDIHSARRDLQTIYARQAIYYWAWRLTPLSSVQISKRLNRRDHTSVLAGISSYQRKRAQMGRQLRELRRSGQ